MSVAESLTGRSPISVGVEGIYVLLTIGNRSVKLDYNTANRLAVLLRGHGREAKRNAGDTSRLMLGFAHLTDATLDELRAQKSRNCGVTCIQAP